MQTRPPCPPGGEGSVHEAGQVAREEVGGGAQRDVGRPAGEVDVFATNLHAFHALAEAALRPIDGTFTKVRTIGETVHKGKVYQYRWQRDGVPDRYVAGKVQKSHVVRINVLSQSNDRIAHFNPNGPPHAPSEEDGLNEIGVMSFLQQQSDAPCFLLKMITAFVQDQNISLITEYIADGDLFTWVESATNISEVDSMRYLHQILIGVNYLHSHHIAHRDISLENILITFADDPMGQIRIFDYGQACITHSPCGTRALRYFRPIGKNFYRAPECIVPKSLKVQVIVPPGRLPGEIIFTLSKGYLCEVCLPNNAQPGQECQADVMGYMPIYSDMFAVGVCFFILMWHVPPWQLAMPVDASFRFVLNRGIPNLIREWNLTPMSDQPQELLNRLMAPDPARRPSAEICLERYFL